MFSFFIKQYTSKRNALEMLTKQWNQVYKKSNQSHVWFLSPSTYHLCTTGPLAGSGAGQGRWRPYTPNSWSPPLFQMIRQTYQQCESGRWCHTQTLDPLQMKQETAVSELWPALSVQQRIHRTVKETVIVSIMNLMCKEKRQKRMHKPKYWLWN